MPTKKTHEEFINEVYNLVGDEYSVLGEYTNSKTKVLVKHNKCNYEYEVKPEDFIGNKRCPNCYSTPKKTTEEFKKEVADIVGDEYTVLGEYVNNVTKIRMQHNSCGYDEWYVTPNKFLSLNRRCPKCANILRSKNNIKTDNECPNCANNREPSNSEKEVLSFIQSFYTKEIKTSYTGILSNHKELDMYFPDCKVAIEFDGLYWHSDKFKNKNFHLDKTLECEKKGIQLIHIFEDEWNNKQSIVKAKIKYLLKSSKELQKIRASKCYVAEVSATDKNQFLNENHIQGEDKANVKLGLWYPINDEEDRLVSVITFCKPRKSLNGSSNYDYELSRFANDIEFQVYGSFDKLFNYFKDNYEWNSIITYADRRWSKGGLYEATGFVLDHVSKPNYWYCLHSYIRYHRFNFRKSELKSKFPDVYDDSKTEFEIMDKTSYSRLWDCGNLVYYFKK